MCLFLMHGSIPLVRELLLSGFNLFHNKKSVVYTQNCGSVQTKAAIATHDHFHTTTGKDESQSCSSYRIN